MFSQPIPFSKAEAAALDATDPLAAHKSAFQLPAGVTYLVGHSLGPATHSALARLRQAAESEWANGLVGSWNTAHWIDLAERVGAQIAPLIGVAPDDILISDSVSVNLYKLAISALPIAVGKRQISIEEDEFPTDQYMMRSVSDLTGADFRRLPAGEGAEALKGGGILIKSAVNYRTAEIADIAAHEANARNSGGLIIWDLSHATGVIALNLAANGAKLAAGCTYKYLNGGPGAPAFIYAAPDIVGELNTPLPGWMGHAQPFAFHSDYAPRDGVARFAAGTPPILSLSALSGALDVFAGLSMSVIQAKSRALGDLCFNRALQIGLKSTSPTNAAARGGHISLYHPEGYAITRALADLGFQSDFRTPDTIRFGLSPLFLSYSDVWDTMDALEDIVTNRLWDRPEFKVKAKVT